MAKEEKKKHHAPPPVADINVTPMVDVMLVLLIIFMVTAPMLVTGLNINLPRANTARPVTQKPPVIVTVTKEGKYFLGTEELPRAMLPNAVRSRLGDNQPAYIQGDREASYGTVISVVDLLNGAGVAKVVMIVERKSGASVEGEPTHDHSGAGESRQ